MACGCSGSKPTTQQVYVLTSPDGSRQEFVLESDARAAQTAAGGGTITPVRK